MAVAAVFGMGLALTGFQLSSGRRVGRSAWAGVGMFGQHHSRSHRKVAGLVPCIGQGMRTTSQQGHPDDQKVTDKTYHGRDTNSRESPRSMQGLFLLKADWLLQGAVWSRKRVARLHRVAVVVWFFAGSGSRSNASVTRASRPNGTPIQLS